MSHTTRYRFDNERFGNGIFEHIHSLGYITRSQIQFNFLMFCTPYQYLDCGSCVFTPETLYQSDNTSRYTRSNDLFS